MPPSSPPPFTRGRECFHGRPRWLWRRLRTRVRVILSPRHPPGERPGYAVLGCAGLACVVFRAPLPEQRAAHQEGVPFQTATRLFSFLLSSLSSSLSSR